MASQQSSKHYANNERPNQGRNRTLFREQGCFVFDLGFAIMPIAHVVCFGEVDLVIL
jgi:hypothetical protein